MERPFRSIKAPSTFLRHLGVYALPCLLCWSVYFLAYYPGMMSQDSLAQWRPVYTFDFDDWHPAILSYLYWGLSRLWLSPGVVCVAQMLGLALVFGYGMVQLERLGLPRWALVLVTLFFCLFPLNGFLINTLFKDVPFSIAFLLAFIYLLLIVESKGLWLRSRTNLLVFAFTLGFICVIRHNGIITVLTIAGALLFSFWALKKRIAVLLILTVGTVFLVKGPLYTAIKVHGRFLGLEMLMTHQIAAVLQEGAALTQKEKQFLNTLLPPSSWQKYNPYEVDSLLFDGNFNYSLLMQEPARKQYQGVWFGIIKRNIPALLRHQVKVTDLVWNIGLQPGSYNYAIHPVIDANDLGLQMQPVLPVLGRFLTKGINYINAKSFFLRAILLRPATYLYLNILLLLLISRYTRRKEALVLALPLLSLAFGLILTIPAQHVRYLYPCFLLAPFLAGYWLILFIRAKELQRALIRKEQEVFSA